MKIFQRIFRMNGLILAAASVLAFATGAGAQNQNASNSSAQQDNSWPYSSSWRSPVLAVVGDISCQPDEDFVSGGGESAHETCDTPKAPYMSTTSTPPGPPYSLYQSQEATANQIEQMKPDAVALLGDLQYQVGEYQDFERSFDLTYGAFKFLHRPAPGNHEFYDEHGETGVAGYGYFSYYNGFQLNPDGSIPQVTLTDPCPSSMTGCGFPGATTPVAQPVPRPFGQAGQFLETGGLGSAVYDNGPLAGTTAPVGVGNGWYSYNLGSWHLISLNIECETQPGGCSTAPGTWLAAETEWLKNDLASNHSACTLAYWHQPTYSAADSLTEEGITAGTWWQILYEYGADLVLNGHDHLYARYAPIKPYFASGDTSVAGVSGTWLGTPDPKHGIREFIVGTGGETLDTVVSTPASATDWDGIYNQKNLEAATGNFWGVMSLTLNRNSYAWDFESALELPGAPAGTFKDSGVGACHGGPGSWDGDNQGRN